MTFITRDDTGSSIRSNILDSMIEFDDTKFTVAVSWAISEMAGYLNSKYDTTAIFAATGVDRNPVVMMFCIDLALYHLHSATNPKKIPDHRKERYTEAKQWLMDVSAGLINPPDLPKPTDGTKEFIIFGGNTPRSNHI